SSWLHLELVADEHVRRSERTIVHGADREAASHGAVYAPAAALGLAKAVVHAPVLVELLSLVRHRAGPPAS
ncbi:MAG: hypothetical protein AAFY58_07795, partial [Planctomycetota bacterium]